MNDEIRALREALQVALVERDQALADAAQARAELDDANTKLAELRYSVTRTEEDPA